MAGLLDVNILVALFDPDHDQHEHAHRWFDSNAGRGWATCTLTQNGLVRIISHPSYPGRRTTMADGIARLKAFLQADLHTYWEDSVPISDPAIRSEHIRGPSQITDITLLALAVRHHGCLVTFDRRVNWRAVVDARADSLEHP